MAKVKDLVKEIYESRTTVSKDGTVIVYSTKSHKDEVAVMRAMLNDKEYKVDVYGSNGVVEEQYCPSEEARSMFSTVISNATHMSKTETDGLMDNYEFKNQEANAMIGLSKEFINTYLNTGRKLPLGGREKSNASLIKKVVPAGTLKYPVRVGKDKNGKSICEAKEVHVESYDAVKSYSPCPAWIKKKNK